jgi:hypothetical protein
MNYKKFAVKLDFKIKIIPYHLGSRDSLFGIATDYGLDDQGVGVRVLRGHEFSLLHVVQTSSAVHTTFYPMGTGGKTARA